MEDERERIDENLEYIKALNMRLRPETCPELHESELKTKTVETPDGDFQKLVGHGADPRFMGEANA